MTGAIPFLRFDSGVLAPDQRLAQWASLAGAYDVHLEGGLSAEQFEMRNTTWRLGELTIAAGEACPLRLARTVDHVAADGRDGFSVVLIQQGSWMATAALRTFPVASGGVCLLDFGRPWETTGTATRFVILSVPRRLMETLTDEVQALHGRRLAGVLERLMADHLSALVRLLPEAEAKDAPALERVTFNILADALGDLSAGADLEDAPAVAFDPVRDRIRAHIDRNLSDRDLGAVSIGRSLGLTRSTTYRAFAGVGGVHNYILRRRLDKAHMQVIDPRDPRGLLDIALALGFSSHAHFTNAFRRRFGYSPRTVRRRGAPSGSDSEAIRFEQRRLRLGPHPGDPAS